MIILATSGEVVFWFEEFASLTIVSWVGLVADLGGAEFIRGSCVRAPV